MSSVNNEPPKSGFFGSIFSSKSKEAEPTTQEKTKSVSPLKAFVKGEDSFIPAKLFGRAKEIKPEKPITRPKINQNAIQKQGAHLNAVKISKLWAKENVSNPLGTSANEVHALRGHEDSSRTAAFFKRGSENESASGTMEEFMWKTATILGDTKQFVATSQTEVVVRTLPTEKNGPPVLTQEEKMKGGIQTAEQSVSLGDYIDHPPGWSVDRSNFLKASLTSMVYGMNDAHASNILINKDSHEIVFFDNTRSLPSGNEYLDRGYGLVPSYRSGLMELDDSYVPLSNAEIAELKQQLAQYRSKLDDLKQFMNSPQTIHSMDSLPPGWMDRKASFDAMSARIDRLEETLNTSDTITMRDLAMAMSPPYRFFSSLEIAHTIIQMKKDHQVKIAAIKAAAAKGLNNPSRTITVAELSALFKKQGLSDESIKNFFNDPKAELDEGLVDMMIMNIKDPDFRNMNLTTAQSFQKNSLGSTGFRTLQELFDELESEGIDPTIIYEFSEDGTKSFDEVVMDIGNYIESHPSDPIDESKKLALLKQCYADSVPDFKDISRNKAAENAYQLATENLEMADLMDNCAIENTDPPTVHLEYEYNDQKQSHVIDYLTIPGKMIIQYGGKELPPMNANEVKEWMKSRALPKGSEGFMQLIAKFNDNNIPLKALNPFEAARAAQILKNGEFFVAQQKGQNPPILKLYQKNAQGQIETYDLTFKYDSKIELTLKLGSFERTLTPEKLQELLIKSSK